MRRVQVGMALAAGMLVTAIPSQATAIQDGQVAGPDEFTNVAVLRFIDTDTNTRWRCSGTLVAPDVIITAAHCTEAADTVYYSFAPVRPTREPDASGDTGWTPAAPTSTPSRASSPTRTGTVTFRCRASTTSASSCWTTR